MSKTTALYCRLSHEDSRDGESMSIENQRHILTRFAAERGFTNTKFYVDDGYTGVDFIKRPALNQLRTDIENGVVSTLIAKDQSRLGRHLFGVLGFKQMCEDYGVRYITVTDNYDTAVNGYDEMMSTVRDLMNDFFAADTSKKIRAVKRNSAVQGKVLGKMP